eukprot:4040354-Pleurochrysis_carterae.AAC.1
MPPSAQVFFGRQTQNLALLRVLRLLRLIRMLRVARALNIFTQRGFAWTHATDSASFSRFYTLRGPVKAGGVCRCSVERARR